MTMLHGQRDLTGIVGAVLTPFTPDGSVQMDALQREIEYMIGDVDALTIAAVEAAEYSVLAPGVRRELIREAIAMVDRRVPVIAGASHPAPGAVVDLAGHAASAGADWIQVLMPTRPWGGQPTTGELVAYYEFVARRSPLPIVAYHNPGPGADPPIEAWIAIADIDRVGAFKESSRDITKIGRLIEELERAGRARYFTTMQPLLATLLMGGSGATMPPPGTRVAAQVARAFRAGDLELAVTWQRFFSVFPGRWARYGLPPIMKAAMRHAGVPIGDPTEPFGAVGAVDDEEIGRLVRAVGLVVGDSPRADAVEPALRALLGGPAVARRRAGGETVEVTHG